MQAYSNQQVRTEKLPAPILYQILIMNNELALNIWFSPGVSYRKILNKKFTIGYAEIVSILSLKALLRMEED